MFFIQRSICQLWQQACLAHTRMFKPKNLKIHGFQAYSKNMTQKLKVFLKKTHENSISFLLHPSASQVPPAPEQRRKPEVKAAAWEREDHPAYWMILDGQIVTNHPNIWGCYQDFMWKTGVVLTHWPPCVACFGSPEDIGKLAFSSLLKKVGLVSPSGPRNRGRIQSRLLKITCDDGWTTASIAHHECLANFADAICQRAQLLWYSLQLWHSNPAYSNGSLES